MKLLCALQCGGVNGEAIHDQAQPVDAGGEVAYGKSDLPFARDNQADRMAHHVAAGRIEDVDPGVAAFRLLPSDVDAVGGRVRLRVSASEASDVTLRIYRDGAVVADGLAGTTTSWTDPAHDADGPRSPCYAVEATFRSSGNHSQHSPPACWCGPSNARITAIGAAALSHVGG